MDNPPNLLPIINVIKTENQTWSDGLHANLVCPICGFNYNHMGDPFKAKGNDSYEAWIGRGDLLVIPFQGECGSEWEFCFGFHKGETVSFVRVCKSCTEDNYLYFIEAEGTDCIKIGRSGNPERRIQQLATGSPYKLILLGKISGEVELEKEIHASFKESRTNGEWFRVSAGLREFIKRAITQRGKPLK